MHYSLPHLDHTLSSGSIPSGHRNIMQTEINEPKEGDYFSIKKDGEDWPVVICDEEIIQTFFARSPRPESARQADGTWVRNYKTGGFLSSDRCFPAINLGTLEFIWTPLKKLEPIDIDMGRAIRSSTTNHLLARAWSEYISQFKGEKVFEWRYIDHWKAKLHAQSVDKTVHGVTKKGNLPVKMHAGLKRKGTPKFKYPPGYHNEELDDEESDDLFLPKGNPAEPKIKRESISSISAEEMDALYDDADPPYPTSSQSSKRSKLDLFGRFSAKPSTPLRAGAGRLTTPIPSFVRRGTPSQSSDKKTNLNDPNTVTIYVDNPHKIFKVRRKGLDASPFLSKLLTHHPENGWYIMSPMLSSINANDFQPVGEYVDRGEYHPNIVDEGTVHVRLEGDLDPEFLRHEIVRCGTIYQIARMLEIPGLQDLAFRKLKALAPYHQALEILTVIELLFEIGSLEIRRYLTQHVADHYWNIVLVETERMVEVMSANEDLAKGVFRILSGKDDNVKTEEVVKEEVVKEEGKKEVLAERKGGKSPEEKDEVEKHAKINDKSRGKKPGSRWSFCDANEVENFDTAVDEGNAPLATAKGEATTPQIKTNEGLSQAEEDMVKMALRESDEKSEDDWVQLVQKQSDLFEAF